jgi:hypothetical protein
MTTMPAKPPYNLSGTVPQDHGLDRVRQQLFDDPRGGAWAIVKIRNADTGTAHPPDEPDQRRMLIQFDLLEPVTDVADLDQVRAMAARARESRPGQAALIAEED